MEKNSCCVFGEISLVSSCIMSCSNRTRSLLGLSTELMRLSRALKEKRAHYYSRHDKIILLHDNARPHVTAPVKTYLETLKWEVLPRRILQTLLLPTTTCSDRWRMACLSSTSHHMKIKLYRWLDSFKRRWSVLPMRYTHARKMGKSSD